MAQDDRALIAERDNAFLAEAAVAKEFSETAKSVRPTWILRQLLNRERPNTSILRDIAGDFQTFVKNRNSTYDMYVQMRTGFSVTRGRSNALIGGLLRKHVPSRSYDLSQTIFQVPDADSLVKDAVAALQKNAYWKAPFLAPPDVIERLKAKLSAGLEKQYGDGFAAAMRADEGAPPQLKSKSAWLMTFEEMYLLASDPIFTSIAHSYLGVPPIFDVPVAFLNSTVKLASRADYSKIAQLYHHDMDRLSFVKLFIYLTDVDMESGPHTLIPATHRKRPGGFWEARRYSDKELDKAGLLSREVKITGPAGTVFLVDTSTLHKGSHPISRPRLVAQMEYSNCLFGLRAAAEEHKVKLSASSKDGRILQSAELVRKYADKAGVRFMQRYI
ncbi:phytanoyl-CoA dioxygenase family protein [Mesorhizobium yinganensis]|uniref:phytanoyl-CoA dioxygenase family protein n=1 Tax=Mesorhizobium yinganensis TaxID=3157707 RepID=UPI0032B7BF64